MSTADSLSPEIVRCMEQESVTYSTELGRNGRSTRTAGDKLDAVLIDLLEADDTETEELVARGKEMKAPVIAIVSPEAVADPKFKLATDDFVVCPWQGGELGARLRRLVEKQPKVADAPGVTRIHDLVIDTTRYDVHLAGKPVLLTFKEYELLKLLASHPGRVFTREQLLEQVWGYEYFGGTRTVDVHIRRLRSKIEDAGHTFIDTVWNVGYRFKE